MLAAANTGTVLGIEALPVTVEAHRANGLPGLTLIGLARGAARESVVRVRSAIMALDLSLGTHKLVVNLLPAELPKEASALDLALALALLASGGAVPARALAGRLFWGELSLGGVLQPARGAVLLAELARRRGDAELVLPAAQAGEAAIMPGVAAVGAACLGAVLAHLRGTACIGAAAAPPPAARPPGPCLADVAGQPAAKRALLVAAAGGHNVLLVGPPGSGKTMLARRLPGLLPPLSDDERIEISRIHSAASRLPHGLLAEPPFRAPHHSASEPALCGGGAGSPRPGEVTLAHRGVLFLDELPEFRRNALEALRQPLEEGELVLARAQATLRFPAQVLLVAAMNPCPCGYSRQGLAVAPPALPASHASPVSPAPAAPLAPAAPAVPPGPSCSGRACICSFDQVRRYRARLSGPLLDRIDLHVTVGAQPLGVLTGGGDGASSAALRPLVARARAAQAARLGPGRTNSTMTSAELRAMVPLTAAARARIEAAAARHDLTGRALARLCKVARTLADLEAAAASAASAPSVAPAAADVGIDAEHVEEALGMRLPHG